jgi:hypothetical protein
MASTVEQANVAVLGRDIVPPKQLGFYFKNLLPNKLGRRIS